MKALRQLALSTLSLISVQAEEIAPSPSSNTDDLNSVTYDLGPRQLTVQEVDEEALPTPPPKTETPSPPASPASYFAPVENPHPNRTLTLGATVFRSKTAPARTLISFQPEGSATSIVFWSSADWRLLANMGTVTGKNGLTWDMILFWSVQDVDQNTIGSEVEALPKIPVFPPGKSTYQVIDGTATSEQLAPIELLHELYDSNYDQLKNSFELLEAERLKQEAHLKAHPPEKEDVVIQYRLLKSDNVTAE